MEPVRPALKEPTVVYLASYAAILAAASGITLLLPSPIRFPLVLLAGIFATVPISLGLWQATYVHFTEEYGMDDGQVIIRRGFLTRTGTTIPLRNVVDIQAVLPFPLRLLGVGVVKISTNDGVIHILYNIRKPVGFVDCVRVLLKS